MPSLPQKRWFERQRWLNRFDDKYTLTRRLGLQEFLRELLRIPEVIENSKVLRTFIDLDHVNKTVRSIYEDDDILRLTKDNATDMKKSISNLTLEEINERLMLS